MAALVSSGRELFMADASVFVDDAEAYEVYEREEESEAKEESVNLPSFDDICSIFCRLLVMWEFERVKKTVASGPGPIRAHRTQIIPQPNGSKVAYVFLVLT